MRKILIGAAAVALFSLAAVLVRAEEKPAVGPLPGTYVGESTCKMCHFQQDKTWKATKHPHATEVLPAKYKDNAQCDACHTTGAGQPGGFESIEKTPKMEGVQCEMCHGPGSEHAAFAKANLAKKADPEVKAKLKELIPVPTGDRCTHCHLVIGHGKHPEFER